MDDPLFFTFEGGEGAGKSSLIAALAASLSIEFPRREILVVAEPGSTDLGKLIRTWLLDASHRTSISLKAELLLFLTARSQLIEELIKPALLKGVIVLCDRFNDSTIVYQGIVKGLGKEYVKSLCSYVCQEIIPKQTFFLNVDPLAGLLRTKVRKKEFERDRFEQEAIDFHAKIQEGFLTLAGEEPKRILVIDANLTRQEVYSQVWTALKKAL